MPSRNQTTLCQQCGDLVPTAEMPLHVARHTVGAALNPARDAITVFERVMSQTLCQACVAHDAEQARAFERSFERITGRHIDAPPAHVLRDLLCNDAPATCDCFYRAEATHEEVTETALTVASVEQPCSEFAGPYAERGDAIAELLDAVSSGATLEVQGPRVDDSTVRAWILESAAGKRFAQAEGSAIGPVLVELARNWKSAT